jgi:SPX domain protein involved in polyphosphate accumulation
MKGSIKMEDYDGYLGKFTKQHKTKNLPLRWFANLCEKPAHYHLNIFLHHSDHDDYGLKSRFHARLSYWLYKPYLKWGTVYKLDKTE